MSTNPDSPRTLARLLAALFLLALLMGPGPGSMLIDGTPEQPRTLFGVPALYLWLVFWWMVMAACILTAARTLWTETD